LFILTAQLAEDDDARGCFERYRAYLRAAKDAFPPSAYALATSDWYFSASDSRCPHDAWLESAEIGEAGSGKRGEPRSVSLTLRLLGAYRDGWIELKYSGVVGYSMRASNLIRGHRDWRYDEFRLSERGGLVHEIEFWGRGETAAWTIECADVRHIWTATPDAAKQSTE
jgi:hypothetical protein